MAVPHVIIVGADKGGVGKTMISRTVMDYFHAKGVAVRAFDTEAPQGNLKRFFPEETEVVDLTHSNGQMRVFDGLKAAPVTIVDVRAGLLSPTLRTLSEVGFLDGAKDGRLKITVLHILGSTQASFGEIKTTAGLVDGSRHIIVVNRINEASFLGLSESMKAAAGDTLDIGKLNEIAADHVDATGSPFSAFVADSNNSEVLRGYVRSWEARIFKQFDAVELHKFSSI